MRSFIVLCLVVLVCACASHKTTSLRVVTPKEVPLYAQVTIDDENIGSLRRVREHGVALPPGRHRITVEATGYLPFDIEVNAPNEGGLLHVQIQMIQIPN